MSEFNTKRWFDITPLDGEIWKKIHEEKFKKHKPWKIKKAI